MDFKRRLKLYLLGLGLGCLVAWGIFGNRLTNTEWLPDYRVKLRLANTLTKATPAAKAMLAPLHLGLADLRTGLDSCDVDFSKSIRSKDSLVYYVHGTVSGLRIHFMAATLRDFRTDSTATLVDIGLLAQ